MLLTAAVFLGAPPEPSREAIEAAMENSLCRCGAHTRIIAAILSVAKQMKVPA
jgi:nicotinate dehydrogenase subunit A